MANLPTVSIGTSTSRTCYLFSRHCQWHPSDASVRLQVCKNTVIPAGGNRKKCLRYVFRITGISIRIHTECYVFNQKSIRNKTEKFALAQRGKIEYTVPRWSMDRLNGTKRLRAWMLILCHCRRLCSQRRETLAETGGKAVCPLKY